MNRHHPQSGLTLIEVLVALVVLGTAIATAMSMMAMQTANTRALDEQILARIVAENAMVDLVLSDQEDTRDEPGGTVEMVGESYIWTVDQYASPYVGIEIISVRVANSSNESRTLAELSTLRVQ